MKKKYIILCEGKHDRYFLSHMMKNYNKKYETFNLEEEREKNFASNSEDNDKYFKKTKRKNIEANKITLFKKISNKNLVLIKNEGDRDKCLEQFMEIADNVPEHIYITIFLDNDNHDINKSLKRIIIEKTGKPENQIFSPQYIKEYYGIRTYLANPNHRLVIYPHIDSLEGHIMEVTGINIDKKKGTIKKDKIIDFYSKLDSTFKESIHDKIFNREY